MLRVIKRDLSHPRSETTVTAGLERTRDATHASLNALLPHLDDREFRHISRLLANEKGKVIFDPGAGAGSEGPIVRFDCHWVSWKTGVFDPGDPALPGILLVDPEADLPENAIELGGGIAGE